MDLIQKNLLEQVAGLHEIPEGAYNIRANGTKLGRNTTANIDIVTKTDKDGIDIIIKPGTVNESVHIPVLLSESGMQECVYNDFYIGEGADVTIVAGCGILPNMTVCIRFIWKKMQRSATLSAITARVTATERIS